MKNDVRALKNKNILKNLIHWEPCLTHCSQRGDEAGMEPRINSTNCLPSNLRNPKLRYFATHKIFYDFQEVAVYIDLKYRYLLGLTVCTVKYVTMKV